MTASRHWRFGQVRGTLVVGSGAHDLEVDVNRWYACGPLAALLVVIPLALSGPAEARPILNEKYRVPYSLVFHDFCGRPGLTVTDIGFNAGKVLANTHGTSGLAYFLEHIREKGTVTNVANGRSVTYTNVAYGTDGKAIARNPGQIRDEILIDNAGTPLDPFDDEFLAYIRSVRSSTGRNDDWCAAMVSALT
jgi:hypothetical protein